MISAGTERWTRPRSRTLGELLDEVAERQPEAPAAIWRTQRRTYAELAADSRALAAGLASCFGIRRGDRIALLCTNRLEWLTIAFAAARLGAPLVAISTWSKAVEIDYVLRHSRPALLVMLEAFRNTDYREICREILPELRGSTGAGRFRSASYPSLRGVVTIPAREGARPLAGLTRRTGAAGGPAAETEAWASATDPALVLYTSGSTARPKAVPLLHYACIENGYHIGERQGLGPSDRVWLAVPLFWSYGSVNALMAATTHGAAVVLQDAFEAGEALDVIERERCTVYYGLPNICRALVEHPSFRPERTRSLRTGLTIGSPADLRLATDTLGVAGICNIYGSTETYGNCAVTPTTDPFERRAAAQGPALPGVTLRVVDPSTRADVPSGETGEFWVKGYLTPGYLDDPEQTCAAFTPDGFYRTGDTGYVDADGYLHFQGRRHEMIKSGGINVSPLEVEAFLASCEGVLQACVVGVPHPSKGEAVAVLVVRRPGAGLSPEALRAECRARIAAYKVPELVLFVEELPRTETGKVHRRRAAELAREEWNRRGG